MAKPKNVAPPTSAGPIPEPVCGYRPWHRLPATWHFDQPHACARCPGCGGYFYLRRFAAGRKRWEPITRWRPGNRKERALYRDLRAQAKG